MNNEINLSVEMEPVNSVTIEEQEGKSYNELKDLPKINGVTVNGSRNGAYYSLQDKISATNKISADFVDDSTSTNKFVTSAEKSNFVKKNESPTLNAGDTYAFNFQTSGGNEGKLQMDENFGLEIKNETGDAGVYLRNDGEVQIESSEDKDVIISRSSGARVTVGESEVSFSGTNAPQYNNSTMALASDIKDATITLTQGGVTKGSFTLNQSSNATIALDSGGSVDFTSITGYDATKTQVLFEDTGTTKWKTKKNAYNGFTSQYNYIISKNSCPASYSSVDIIVKCSSSINAANSSNNQIFIGTPNDSFCFFNRHNSDHKFSVWSGSESIGTTALQEYQTTFWLRLVANGSGAGNLYYLADNNYTLATLPATTSWTNECSFTGASVASKKLTVSQPAAHCALNTTFYEARAVVDDTVILDIQDPSTYQIIGSLNKTDWYE